MCASARERERKTPCSKWASRGERVWVSRFDAPKNVTIRKYSGCCEGWSELRRVAGRARHKPGSGNHQGLVKQEQQQEQQQQESRQRKRKKGAGGG